MRKASWDDWLPPELLLECRTPDGTPVFLCDFGSAGSAGTPYDSWLPMTGLPRPASFDRSNPERTQP